MPSDPVSPFVSAAAALSRAVRQLPEPEMRTPLLLAIAWTLVGFAVLWGVVGWNLDHWLAHENAYLGWTIRVLGMFAAPYLTMLLFPIIATMVVGLYSERLILTVEHRFYPALAVPPASRWGDQIRSIARLLAISSLATILALPFYLVFPGANLVLFLALNGYVLARSYFDLVTLRRMDWAGSRRLWTQSRVAFILSGIVIAALFSLPILNIVAPVVGIAAAVHLLERYRAMVMP